VTEIGLPLATAGSRVQMTRLLAFDLPALSDAVTKTVVALLTLVAVLLVLAGLGRSCVARLRAQVVIPDIEQPSGGVIRPIHMLRPCAVAAAILLAASMSACAAQPGGTASGSAAQISDPVRIRLLAIADQEAGACNGTAVRVRVARSTRDVATMATMQEVGQIGDKRRVWAMLVTGGTYTCAQLGPSGAPASAPSHDLLTILDATTYVTTDGGSGPGDTLNGLSPVISLR
jgi:hypothetical protein